MFCWLSRINLHLQFKLQCKFNQMNLTHNDLQSSRHDSNDNYQVNRIRCFLFSIWWCLVLLRKRNNNEIMWFASRPCAHNLHPMNWQSICSIELNRPIKQKLEFSANFLNDQFREPKNLKTNLLKIFVQKGQTYEKKLKKILFTVNLTIFKSWHLLVRVFHCF